MNRLFRTPVLASLLLLCGGVGCGSSETANGPRDGGLSDGEQDLVSPGDQGPAKDGATQGDRGSGDGGPPDLPQPATDGQISVDPGSKSIFVWSSTIRGHETAFFSWLAQHKYTDAFVLCKGVSGTIKYDVLEQLMAIKEKNKSSIRIWLWIVGYNDKTHTSGWKYLTGSWVSPADTVYRQYLVDVVKKGIDPSKGQVTRVPDGVVLDDTFQWPSKSYGSSTAARVSTLMATVDAIRTAMTAVEKARGKTILLGFAPHPENNVVSKDATSITTVDSQEYGQDLGEIAKRCDWILPETYRYGHYGNTASWIAKVVKDAQAEIALEAPSRSSQVRVYPVLVLYYSDTNPSAISAAELTQDRTSALSATKGFGVFRYASGGTNPGVGGDGRDWPTASQNTVLDK